MSISLPLDSVTPGTYGALLDLLRASRSTSRRSALPADLRELVCVRVSQLNGCLACLDVHVPLAVRAGVEQRKLDALEHWRDSATRMSPDHTHRGNSDKGVHSDRATNESVEWSAEEVAALELAERLTLTGQDCSAPPKTESETGTAPSSDSEPEQPCEQTPRQAETAHRHAELKVAIEGALDVLTKEQVAALEWTIVTINAFNRVSIVSEL